MALEVGAAEELGSSIYLQMKSGQRGSIQSSDKCHRSAFVPIDKVLKVLLDEDAELVLDLGNILHVCRASVWDLVVFEALVSLVITRRTEAL